MKHMQELRDLVKTGNTYLKTYTGFYIFWQLISILLMIIIAFSIGIFVIETKGLMMIFRI